MSQQRLEVLLTEDRIRARVRELGVQIMNDYAGKELVLISVLKGSFMFTADLARAIDMPLSIEFLGLKSYGDSRESSGVVQITADITRPIANKHVVIVEDIIDTGLTMNYLRDNLATRQPASVKLCALLHKPSRARVPTTIEYLGFTIEDVFVVGYGLDWAERYRNLSHIAVVPENQAPHSEAGP